MVVALLHDQCGGAGIHNDDINENDTTTAVAGALDRQDPLARFRDEFILPEGSIYLCGNSLGPQPRTTTRYMHVERAPTCHLHTHTHTHPKRNTHAATSKAC